MLKLLKQTNRFEESLFLGILTLLCVSLSIFRYTYTETLHFLFLNWNLFLAFIPWLLTSLISIHPALRQSTIIVIPLIACWLLFFPNAPYILTDLYHLTDRSSMPVWFDLMLILTYAWTGLLAGFMSLWELERMVSGVIKQQYRTVLIIFLFFLSGFGIYIGRFLRWNSWDVIHKPFHIIEDIAERLVDPLGHPETWGVTIFMGLFLCVLYWSFKIVTTRSESEKGIHKTT